VRHGHGSPARQPGPRGRGHHLDHRQRRRGRSPRRRARRTARARRRARLPRGRRPPGGRGPPRTGGGRGPPSGVRTAGGGLGAVVDGGDPDHGRRHHSGGRREHLVGRQRRPRQRVDRRIRVPAD
jgi:hypothetical protein